MVAKRLFDAAEALINENGDWIRHHLDLEIYKSASAVETAILQGDMEIPLQWCLDHASKLRRIDSALEFYVRQEQVSHVSHLNHMYFIYSSVSSAGVQWKDY